MRHHNVVRAAALLLLLQLLPPSARAQGARREEPLSIPEGQPLRCRRPGPEDGGSSRTDARVFIIGAPDTTTGVAAGMRERKVIVAADSTGRPGLLIEQWFRGLSGGSIVARRISPDTTQAVRQDLVVDSAALMRALSNFNPDSVKAAMREGERRLLTAAERSSADSLAGWLWARRCHRAP